MKTPRNSEMRAEYDFNEGVGGKYARRYANGANVVFLDADVARMFKDSAAVNAALRGLLVAKDMTLGLNENKRPI